MFAGDTKPILWTSQSLHQRRDRMKAILMPYHSLRLGVVFSNWWNYLYILVMFNVVWCFSAFNYQKHQRHLLHIQIDSWASPKPESDSDRELTICMFKKLNSRNANLQRVTKIFPFCFISQFNSHNVHPRVIPTQLKIDISDSYRDSYPSSREKEVWDYFLNHHKRQLNIICLELKGLSCRVDQ